MFNLWTGEKWNMPKSYNTITSNEDICGQENYEKQLQVFSIVHFSCLIFAFKWLKMQLLVIQKKKRIARVYFNSKSLGKKQHPTSSLLNNDLRLMN